MLKRLLSISLVLLLSFGTVSPLFAQESEKTYQIYRLPKGVYLGEGDAKRMCYTFPQYKLLLSMDADLKKGDTSVPALQEAIKELRLGSGEIRLALSDSNIQLRLMTEDRERVYKKWEQDNEAKHVAENKPAFGSWFPWALSGVLAAVLGGTIVGISVSK